MATDSPPTPTPGNPGTPDPLYLLGSYLYWHAVNVCHATCTLCIGTRAYLASQGVASTPLDRMITERPARQSAIGRAQEHLEA